MPGARSRLSESDSGPRRNGRRTADGRIFPWSCPTTNDQRPTTCPAIGTLTTPRSLSVSREALVTRQPHPGSERQRRTLGRAAAREAHFNTCPTPNEGGRSTSESLLIQRTAYGTVTNAPHGSRHTTHTARRTPLHPPQTAGLPAPILAAATTQRAVRAPVGALPPRMGTWLPRKARGGRRLGWSARAWGVPCSALL